MTSLTLVRRIAARPSIVFDALTTPAGIACWWGPDDGPVLLAETDPAGRMGVLQWLAAALSSVEPYVMALAVNDVFEADRAWSKARHGKVMGDLKARLADLEAALGDNPWLDGRAFTVGDLLMISVLGGLRGTAVLADLPRLAAYVARGESRPAHRKAMADHLATFDVAAHA